jgi:putative sterol carrier protein
MTHKAAYIWGPISSFTGPLTALLLRKGWHVYVACKSALNLFSLSPLDMPSAAQTQIEKALGGHEEFRTFADRLKFIESNEQLKDVVLDAIIFSALPPNFDEARAPRAPWAAQELGAICKIQRGVNVFLVSSLWAGVQPDGVVPEEMEFERRKPLNQWEHCAQQYEIKLLIELGGLESTWHLIRLPLISGSTKDGASLNFSGPMSLLRDIAEQTPHPEESYSTLQLNYNPDATFWFMPVDQATKMFWHILEDESRPRICNLVSTQSTLNREYAEYVAKSLGYKSVETASNNSYKLANVMRQMLKDNIQVKTRNLFEVAGRYQENPVAIDERYFSKLLRFGRANHWGRVALPVGKSVSKPIFSASLARQYFEDFLPMNFDSELLHDITKGDISIGFVIDGPQNLYWVLRAYDDRAMVERLDHGADKPKVSLHFSGDTMMKLIHKKLSLELALVSREVRIEGPIIDGLRVGSIFGRFLKEHPFTGIESKAEVLS